MLARPIHKCQFTRQSFVSPTEIYYLHHITTPCFFSLFFEVSGMSYLYLILTLLTTQEFENTLLSFGPCSHEILANVQVYWSISKLIFFFLPWGFQIQTIGLLIMVFIILGKLIKNFIWIFMMHRYFQLIYW